MTGLLIIIYIVFISLGLPDSLFGVSWPVLHLDFGVPESFAAIYSIIIGVCTGGVSFVAGKLIRRSPGALWFQALKCSGLPCP